MTREEMLECRRNAVGLAHKRTDCTVELTDGIDIDAVLETELRQWYLDLLDNAPRRFVAVDDVVAGIRGGEEVPGGGIFVTVPEACRRVFDLRLDGWNIAASVLPADKSAEIIARQLNPYTAATAGSPVACLVPGATAGTVGGIMAWPAGTLPHVTAAVDTGPELYVFDEVAINTIFKNKRILLNI